jgi:heme O synthase-like polyprenyltransferase
MNIRHIAAALVVAGLGTAHAAQAQQAEVTNAVVMTVGQWIAAQGNAALIQVREDMKRDALKHVDPYLPQPSGAVNEQDSGAQKSVAR